MPDQEKDSQVNSHVSDAAQDDVSPTAQPNISRGIFSLVGLVLIGVVAYYGLPHLSSALGGVTPTEKEGKAAGVIDAAVVDQVQGSGLEQVDRKKLQEVARIAVTGALRKKFQEDACFVQRAKYSESAHKVRIELTLEGDPYFINFEYDEDFDEFVGQVLEGDLQSYFSRPPKFELPLMNTK